MCKEGGTVFYVDSEFEQVVVQKPQWQRALSLHPDTFLAVTADSVYDD